MSAQKVHVRLADANTASAARTGETCGRRRGRASGSREPRHGMRLDVLRPVGG